MNCRESMQRHEPEPELLDPASTTWRSGPHRRPWGAGTGGRAGAGARAQGRRGPSAAPCQSCDHRRRAGAGGRRQHHLGGQLQRREEPLVARHRCPLVPDPPALILLLPWLPALHHHISFLFSEFPHPQVCCNIMFLK